MNSRLAARLALALLPAVGAARAAEFSPLDAEIPVAPVPATAFAGLTNVFELRNSWISATVAPDAGPDAAPMLAPVAPLPQAARDPLGADWRQA